MYGQVIFHRRPDPSLKAAEVTVKGIEEIGE
jgi:hypothetical protein